MTNAELNRFEDMSANEMASWKEESVRQAVEQLLAEKEAFQESGDLFGCGHRQSNRGGSLSVRPLSLNHEISRGHAKRRI